MATYRQSWQPEYEQKPTIHGKIPGVIDLPTCRWFFLQKLVAKILTLAPSFNIWAKPGALGTCIAILVCMVSIPDCTGVRRQEVAKIAELCRTLGACQEFTHEENTKGRRVIISLLTNAITTLICWLLGFRRILSVQRIWRDEMPNAASYDAR